MGELCLDDAGPIGQPPEKTQGAPPSLPSHTNINSAFSLTVEKNVGDTFMSQRARTMKDKTDPLGYTKVRACVHQRHHEESNGQARSGRHLQCM